MQPVRILVVTSSKGFGQLIQQTLEESSRYTVTLVESLYEALITIKSSYYNLTILDDMIKGGTLVDLAQSLRRVQPNLKLIIIPPENELTNAIITAISPDGYLTKPFYLPDLFDTIGEVLGFTQPPMESYLISTGESVERERVGPRGKKFQPMDWMEDQKLVEQHLTHLSLETAAQVALIIRNDRLWVHTGQLSERGALELASIVSEFWNSDGEDAGISGDKIRFTHLNETDLEYLLYVTALGEDMVLALAFDSETPFNKIRDQSVKLARALVVALNHIGEINKNDVNTHKLQEESKPIPKYSKKKRLFDDSHTTDAFKIKERHTSGIKSTLGRAKPQDHSSNTIPHANSYADNTPTPRKHTGIPVYSQRSIGSLEIEDLRPVSPAMHNLSFACLLIPRLPTHHLIGEIAASLAQWLGQLCLAYGWKLEHQSIRPDYLLWIALVSPSTSPSFHIRIIRKQTSQRIFTSFPQLKKGNPSGDFWAPGYLIVSSTQAPTAQIINQYINRTRHHQGT